MTLTARDLHVLEKIRDPEADPTQVVALDDTLPKDPHYDDATHHTIAATETAIIRGLEEAEKAMQGIVRLPDNQAPLQAYQDGVAQLDRLVEAYPQYASARNNRVQALRRLYGDGVLVRGASRKDALIPLTASTADVEKQTAVANSLLRDLDEAVRLLTPPTRSTPISPQTSQTLAALHTQRAALYHATTKLLRNRLSNDDGDVAGSASTESEASVVRDLVGLSADTLREAEWKLADWEEAVSREFALGGWYGNEIAKGLAVSTNPTAKLCGQIVREAMKKEYGQEFSH